MIDPTRTIGYYRVSTIQQADTTSVLARYREDLINFGVLESNLYFDVESYHKYKRDFYYNI